MGKNSAQWMLLLNDGQYSGIWQIQPTGIIADTYTLPE
jgi:hypothetical protein